MKKLEYYKIPCPVGEISSLKLRDIVLDCMSLGIETIQISNRQEIILPLKTSFDKSSIDTRLGKFNFTKPTDNENIVSSFASFEVFPSTSWVNDETYKGFSYFINPKTKLKINIVDPKQNLIPLFSGNLNFIASEKDNQWILVLNFPEHDFFYQFSSLIADYKIATIIETIEKMIEEKHILDKESIEKQLYPFTTRTKVEEEYIATIQNNMDLPVYEGFHSINDTMGWLGIYNHNNDYPGEFIEELAFLCSQQNIGSIFFTTNNSIIVKYIEKKNYPLWVRLIQKYNINLRHSQFLLNCQVDDFDQEGLDLKKYIYKTLTNEDIQLANLTYAITNYRKLYDADIFISPVKSFNLMNKKYNIYHSNQFKSLTKQEILYKENVSKSEIFQTLLELTLEYHKEESQPQLESKDNINQDAKLDKTKIQCPDCLTIYDPKSFGMNEEEIKIALLPDDFKCELCENEKSKMLIIN